MTVLHGTGAERIVQERQRQIAKEGWSEAHDDEHGDASLAWAAVCYAAPAEVFVRRPLDEGGEYIDAWPESWDTTWDKRPAPTSRESVNAARRIRALEKAGALIAAEIDRLLRLGAG